MNWPKGKPRGTPADKLDECLDVFKAWLSLARRADEVGRIGSAVLRTEATQDTFWYAVISKDAPIINKAIKREDVAQEYADKCRETYPGVEIVPLYTAPMQQEEQGKGDEEKLKNEIQLFEPDEYMCPNCVTPWKCNGPHVLD